jgi:hypothetical protein
MNRSDEVINEYRGFLLDVCTAHNYHTKFAIEQLVTCFSHGKYKTFRLKKYNIIIFFDYFLQWTVLFLIVSMVCLVKKKKEDLKMFT